MNQKLQKELFVVGIIVFSCIISFALGRLSIQEKFVVEEVRICSEDQSKNFEVGNGIFSAQSTSTVVASKTGTKYHFPWCSGARTISKENIITFSTIEEARAKGYSPASNCKGLE